MKYTWILGLLACLLITMGCCCPARTTCCCVNPCDPNVDEVDVPLSAVPAVVIAAAKKAVPGIVLEEAEKEVENGVTVYDLEGEVGGREYEIEITADGRVLDIEEEDDDDDDDHEDDDDDDDHDDDD